MRRTHCGHLLLRLHEGADGSADREELVRGEVILRIGRRVVVIGGIWTDEAIVARDEVDEILLDIDSEGGFAVALLLHKARGWHPRGGAVPEDRRPVKQFEPR